MSKFYTFRQNNSYGSFEFSEDYGHTVVVIIEAENAAEANRLAIMKELYFDGCLTGIDCSCCGDRWYPVDEKDGKDEPMIYGEKVAEYTPLFGRPWSELVGFQKGEIAIHYKDGRIEWPQQRIGE